jgi:hypothetical protein
VPKLIFIFWGGLESLGTSWAKIYTHLFCIMIIGTDLGELLKNWRTMPIQCQNDAQMSLDYHLVDPLGDDEKDEQQSNVLDGC